MKAIILAGGFGTRLRPLSCTRPKMLLPVAKQPLIDWCLKTLSNGGVDTVILAVNYMAEALVRYLGTTKYDLGLLTLTEGVTVCPSKTVGQSILNQRQVM